MKQGFPQNKWGGGPPPPDAFAPPNVGGGKG